MVLNLPKKRLTHCLIITLLILICYSNTFDVPFVFDDYPNIVLNNYIKSWEGLKGNIPYGEDAVRIALNVRTLGYASFALNYYLHSLDVWGYHLFNLIIHITASLSLYFLISLLCRSTQVSANAQGILPFFSALIFAVHPIETQAVTYIVQRFASMAGMFYILSIALYLHARLQSNKRYQLLSYVVSLVCVICAMKTKEIAFTLPVMIAVSEFIFFKDSLKNRLILLAPYALTLLIVPLSMVDISKHFDNLLQVANVVTRKDFSISRTEYLFTQFVVIVKYISLMFPPVIQNLDYDFPIYKNFFDRDVIASFTLHVLIILFAIYLIFRGAKNNDGILKIAGFGIIWFYVALSVESSIFTINDVIFEHRAYLPSAGFLTSMTALIGVVLSKLRNNKLYNYSIILLIGIFSILPIATYARNNVWRSPITLWHDTILKSPNISRPYIAIAQAYAELQDFANAEKFLQKALTIEPLNYAIHNDLGIAYRKLQQFDKAELFFKNSLKLKPDFDKSFMNLGGLYLDLKKYKDAEKLFKEALKINPDFHLTRLNLGITYYYMNRFNEAEQELKKAIELNPETPKAYTYLQKIAQKR